MTILEQFNVLRARDLARREHYRACEENARQMVALCQRDARFADELEVWQEREAYYRDQERAVGSDWRIS